MALPYVTADEAKKIAKEVVRESGSQPQPGPSPEPTPSGDGANVYDLRDYPIIPVEDPGTPYIELTQDELFHMIDSNYDLTKPTIVCLTHGDDEIYSLSMSVITYKAHSEEGDLTVAYLLSSDNVILPAAMNVSAYVPVQFKGQ